MGAVTVDVSSWPAPISEALTSRTYLGTKL